MENKLVKKSFLLGLVILVSATPTAKAGGDSQKTKEIVGILTLCLMGVAVFGGVKWYYSTPTQPAAQPQSPENSSENRQQQPALTLNRETTLPSAKQNSVLPQNSATTTTTTTPSTTGAPKPTATQTLPSSTPSTTHVTHKTDTQTNIGAQDTGNNNTLSHITNPLSDQTFEELQKKQEENNKKNQQKLAEAMMNSQASQQALIQEQKPQPAPTKPTSIPTSQTNPKTPVQQLTQNNETKKEAQPQLVKLEVNQAQTTDRSEHMLAMLQKFAFDDNL